MWIKIGFTVIRFNKWNFQAKTHMIFILFEFRKMETQLLCFKNEFYNKKKKNPCFYDPCSESSKRDFFSSSSNHLYFFS